MIKYSRSFWNCSETWIWRQHRKKELKPHFTLRNDKYFVYEARCNAFCSLRSKMKPEWLTFSLTKRIWLLVTIIITKYRPIVQSIRFKYFAHHYSRALIASEPYKHRKAIGPRCRPIGLYTCPGPESCQFGGKTMGAWWEGTGAESYTNAKNCL